MSSDRIDVIAEHEVRSGPLRVRTRVKMLAIEVEGDADAIASVIAGVIAAGVAGVPRPPIDTDGACGDEDNDTEVNA